MHDNLPQNDFSFDDVKIHWRRYAFKVKETGMETFYNALIRREPVLTPDKKLIMTLDNQVQIDVISVQLQDFTNYMRKSLKNYSIFIQLELNQNPNEEVKFLTGKDKFASLARKNPNLHTLKNTFNLDIEF